MKTRSKEINIFSMSALDLFASALGAFILIAVVLFPYFPNKSADKIKAQLAAVQAELEKTQSEAQASQAQLSACETQRQQVQAALDACEEQQRASVSQDALGACESRNQQLESNLETCQALAKKKFLLVLMSWGTCGDIDLHVSDPAEREFFYRKPSISGSRAKLEEDNTRGPGNEIWLHPAAEPGTYRVYYKYFSLNSDEGCRDRNTRVRGAVLTPEGRTSLPNRTLRRRGEKPLIATITVDAEGNMRVSPR